jgi:rubrerythrin
MSMLENLRFATEHGIAAWLEREHLKWRCASCGSPLSAHKEHCPSCNAKNPRYGPFTG